MSMSMAGILGEATFLDMELYEMSGHQGLLVESVEAGRF